MILVAKKSKMVINVKDNIKIQAVNSSKLFPNMSVLNL